MHQWAGQGLESADFPYDRRLAGQSHVLPILSQFSFDITATLTLVFGDEFLAQGLHLQSHSEVLNWD